MGPGLSCRNALVRKINSMSDQEIEDHDYGANSADDVEEEAEGGKKQPTVERLYDLEPEDDITTDPLKATEDGYSYTPPTDPPVVSSDDLEEAEIAVGFASNAEGSHPDEEKLPLRVETGDLELENHVYTSLRNNSETRHLTDIEVKVRSGVLFLDGTVETEDDIALVDDIVSALEGVSRVQNRLRVR
jgi:osmotically-inducible protein OsmY